MGRLEDRVAIVTGASGGIGRASAERFVAEGASVMMVDVHEEALAAAAQEIGSDRVAFQVADVSDERQTAAYVEAAESRFGPVDILFGNAGIEGTVRPLHEHDVESFERVLRVNLRGVWLGIRAVVPGMLERGRGSIVLTSSVAGIVAAPGLGPYVASKHALIGLARTAALEYGPRGIRTNTINPGPVDNRMMRAIERGIDPDHPEQVQSGFSERVPLGRYGTNEDIAHMAVFLASDESAYCNGGVYVVDGGYTAA